MFQQPLLPSSEEVILEDDEILNSHDVVSLYTPIKKFLEVIRGRLQTDITWELKTSLTVEDVME